MAANRDLALAARDLLCAGVRRRAARARTQMLGSMAAVPLPAGPAPTLPRDRADRRGAVRSYRIEVPITALPVDAVQAAEVAAARAFRARLGPALQRDRPVRSARRRAARDVRPRVTGWLQRTIEA